MAASKPTPPRRKSKKGKGKWFVLLMALVVGTAVWIWFAQKPKSLRKTKTPATQPSKNPTRLASARRLKILTLNKTNAPSATNRALLKTNSLSQPAVISPSGGRTAQTILEAQIALARLGISPGSIDGSIGSQTRAALRAFQQNAHLPVTGELDPTTKAKLILEPPVYTDLTVTTDDLARLQPLGTNWFSKSQQSRLDYETILEFVAEKTFSHPDFIKQLNPAIDWSNVTAGTRLRVPNVEKPKVLVGAAFVHIHLAGKNLEAFDAETNLLAHFPCSIAQHVDKRPVGELHVSKIAVGPDYTFNPEIFPESAEARTLNSKLIISPGPNNPVGTVWIGLDKPGYGIHGTPTPESVGRTESHGCFRLANWNAEFLVRLVSVGTPVYVDP
ncbi:MAG: L,D-transpeptidase [Verrucomicrobiota bacterium]